ncbi:S41 family peptidase [Aquibacillus sp. 3ASR75-11]|uniref:C-terminal processing peptidase n=1 Tax=Terrihalobacillus insolitus TaxID=2950438 RepID=A0A9X3WPY9_9BACI|nr:S41 family peptidase [Terrihalobacillus insolitus]MDC3412246.1 S41 family peptidase [Terrihalobacillus insolitus]MDC3423060.1 S41 family peptidase [Terrihalobacillus insolitus]
MTIKKQYIVLMLVAAVIVGAVGSYIGIQLAQPNAEHITDDNALEQQRNDSKNFGDMSPEEQQEFLGSALGMEEMSKVMQAYTVIKDNYVEEVEQTQLVEGAIQGMLDSLEDPYSVFMDKKTVEQFNDSIESSFEGIGAEVSMVEGNVTIIAPIKGSPAEKAGLKPNDQILQVNGESLEGLDLYEAVMKIRGEKGSEVKLQIERPGVSELLEIPLVRDNIPLETVYSDTKEVKGNKVGVIEITSFSEKTAKDFKKALNKLENDGIEGLVLDVRGNPGGLLSTVEEILKEFIPKEDPYVQIEDRNGKKERYFSELDEKKDYPITVLIDEGSASASEILAGAMKEAGGYDIVGTTSFGKGTVQQTIPMGDGSTIKLTLFKWLTPDGNWIHKKGIEPTIEVKQPDYFYANRMQIEETLKYNSNGDKIKNIQIMLRGLGYDPGRDDGYYSQQTMEAVKAYQQDNGLDVTGEVDKNTAGSIEATILEKVRDEQNDKQLQGALDALFQ